MRLTEDQKRLVENLAASGKGLAEIAKELNLTPDQAYCSDDFAVAFAVGCEKGGVKW